MMLWDQDLNPHYPQGMTSSSQIIVIDWLYAPDPHIMDKLCKH